MSNVVYEIFDDNEVLKAMDFVAESFLVSEKSFYSAQELKQAEFSLKNQEVFNQKELIKAINKNEVSLFVQYNKNKIIGVAGLDVEMGRILFLAGKEDKIVLKNLLEAMTHKRENYPDNKLDILAFVGEEKRLRELGFSKLKQMIFYFHNIKFVAMRYSYEQIDVEI